MVSPLYCCVKVCTCLCLGQQGKVSNSAWAMVDVVMRMTDMVSDVSWIHNKETPSHTFPKSSNNREGDRRKVIAQCNMWLSHYLTTGKKMGDLVATPSLSQDHITLTTLQDPGC